MNQSAGHLEYVDGVMLGRAAYHNPSLMAKIDSRFYGDPVREPDYGAIIEAMCTHSAEHIARGGRLTHVTRHMVGLFHGVPGARRYRQILSTDANKPGATPTCCAARLKPFVTGLPMPRNRRFQNPVS